MALIPDHYMRAVLSIGIKHDRATKWIGTGFFIIREVGENKYQPFMVTNRHVVEGSESIVIRLKKKDSNSLITIDVPLEENGKKLYSVHSDPNIDIAVILLVGSFFEENNLEFAAFDIDKESLTSSIFVEEGGGDGSFVYMLGYPMGLVDVDSNHPICRSGCVARVYSNEILRTKNMLLDIQNFPGNSGSPVISRPEVISLGDTKALNKARLIGIIHSYIPYQETLINSQTGKAVEIRSENSGIANAHPVEMIKEVVALEEQRMKSVANMKM